MKKFLIIGLGNLGYSLSKTLTENGCEVLGIDASKEMVDKAADVIAHAIIADAANKDIIESLTLKDYSAAIVSIGQEMTSSILISLYLIEKKIPKVIVRAISEDHAKILKMIGVHEVIFPEQEVGVRLADRLAEKNVVDYLPLGGDYSFVDIIPPKSFIGSSLKDIQFATRFNCQVIGIRYHPDEKSVSDKKPNIKTPVTANDIITKDSILMIIGRNEDIETIRNTK
jgi:trk system potassium uptake protein